jgi:parallel beta-helix repeat protein
MKKRIVSLIVLGLTLVTMLALAASIHPVRAYEPHETISITSEGVYPSDAPITTIDNVHYFVSEDIDYTGSDQAIRIEVDNITLDGAGHTLECSSEGEGTSGIFMKGIDGVTIKSFTIIGFSSYGIIFSGDCSDNSIIENTIKENGLGIFLGYSSDNHVYHNNFIENSAQADYQESTTFWDNGYPSGGNYWSGWETTDSQRGPGQNLTGSDGIADSPYYVKPEGQEDHYPLMGLFGGSTKTGDNVTVFPAPDLCFIFTHVETEGSTTATASTAPPPPSGMTLISAYYEISITAVYTGKITVRMSYDGTGMTLSALGQRSRLKLLRYDALLTDVNKDSRVDLRDICRVLKALGSRSNTPRWDPACDVNGDGVINCKDLLAVTKDLGKSAWTDITTFVDTINHVVYGETRHFWGIGIHER